MQVRQRLQRSGVHVTPQRTIADVAKLMEASGTGIVAVLDDDRLTRVLPSRTVTPPPELGASRAASRGRGGGGRRSWRL
jgi:CBS domain-containing protein